MLICPKCNAQNQLGRVFCAMCGAKLGLEDVTQEAVSEMAKRPWYIKFKWYLISVPVVIIVLIIVLLWWPDMTEIGKSGLPAGKLRLANYFTQMKNQKPGTTLAYPMDEADINAYLEGIAGSCGYDSLRVALYDGSIRVHIIKKIFNIRKAGYSIEPKTTYDIVYRPVGNVPRPVRTIKGHKSMWPFGSSIVRELNAKLTGQKDWEAFKNVSEIKVDTGKLTLIIKK